MPTDTEMLDFLASLEQNVADVMLPHDIVTANIGGGLRSMIAATMRRWEESRPCSHTSCGTPTQPGPCAFDACPRKA